MWPFLFILAIVPLIFYWSDSAKELFPSLSDKLLDSSETALTIKVDQDAAPEESVGVFGLPADQWVVADSEEGYLAWFVSKDQQYRIAVGCHNGMPAALQVTRTQGQELKKQHHLNFEYGMLPLEKGLYAGSELVGSVAQFKNLYLQAPNGAVLAQFAVSGADSGAIAREISMTCVNEAR